MENNHPITYRIADLETSERPRERLQSKGAESLGNPELLAILLRTGIRGESAIDVAKRLLHDFGGLHGLQSATFQELANIKGIGVAKASQIKAAIEIGSRINREKMAEKADFHSPEDAAERVMYEMRGLQQENLWVLSLDVRNRELGLDKLYVGSANLSLVRIGEVFKFPIQRNASNIIVYHNHPSGDPSPSAEDVALTKALVQASKLLDIVLLDHIIIGQGVFTSLKQEKMLGD
jgi:DNA repair protein RadC